MINFDITEYNFSRKDTEQYQLSILYGVDSFAYIIQDAKGTVVALREYHWQDGKQKATFLEEDEKLHFNYRQVKVAFSKGVFCMVPQRLFQEEEKATYLGHLAKIRRSGNILSDNISQHQAELVYEVEESALQEIDRYFTRAPKRNLHTILLESMRSHAATQASYHVAVHVTQKQLLIYAFDRTNLMLLNAYRYNSAQDFLYYVLLVYEQLGLKTGGVPLYLAGRILEDSDIYRLLIRYIRKLSFLAPDRTKIGPQLERHPAHFFFDLHALANSGR
ncbi:DUF3822 family protein [Flavilitoribacter nigricans]|uniref:DUF3822 family protein n=1 Tax=Flavilitoribacter nigricans (strain ATCC 23147 / DSM 23189 / NBRC 102662 / NCIMB 1420 / SS-2) TaxID=1122177 RepID=A0A2D0MZV1_FLAN2|nr:DUF3822 family protein [Flavilitoribacter nigricans]PHN01775.1 hypothetical protein CRP01_35400 [Flavilitoribacter nigricans DSM 23189 = NBRC 102662]